MLSTVVTGIMLPFLGTAIGSGAVFIMKKNRRVALADCLAGFAGGVMMAASVWSLIIPSIERSENLGAFSFVPSAVGITVGILFMLLSEKVIERLPMKNASTSTLNRLITAFAVTLHNIPEGMAVGMVYAAVLTDKSQAAVAGALSLSFGIAIQNIPEGAIVSLPLFSDGRGRMKSFLSGVISGAVEPLAALVAILFVRIFSPLMAYFLSFAAGAMIFVVINELSCEMREGKGRGFLFFALGFVVMMSLDVALG